MMLNIVKNCIKKGCAYFKVLLTGRFSLRGIERGFGVLKRWGGKSFLSYRKVMDF